MTYFDEPEFAEQFSESRRATAAESASRMIEFAGIQPGQRVVDLCCGPGLVSQHLAERAGATGELIGVDASDAMIDLARANVTAANARFIAGDAYDLPSLVPHTIDHVVATSAWQSFLLDKERIVRAVRGVLKPSGRFTFDVRLRPAAAPQAVNGPGRGRFRERVITLVRKEYPDLTLDEEHDFGFLGVQNTERILYTSEDVDNDIVFLEANGFGLVGRHDVPRSQEGAGCYSRHRWRVDYWLSRVVPGLPAEGRAKILDRVADEMRSRWPAEPRRGLTAYVVMEMGPG